MEFSNVKFMNQDELLKSVEIEEGNKNYNNFLLKLCVLPCFQKSTWPVHLVCEM